jgi:hypothetical protein
MPRIRRRLLTTTGAALVGLVCSVGSSSAAQARATTPRHLCVAVHATGTGQDLGNGMTEATISTHGIVLGHTRATFTPTAVTPTSESFTGPIVFSSRVGTLTAQVQGAFDITAGTFTATSTSIAGTGLLRPVGGTVTLNGTENLSTGAFTETISGRLCVG